MNGSGPRFLEHDPSQHCILWKPTCSFRSVAIAYAVAGTIPVELGMLTALVELSLSYNNLSGKPGIGIL